MAQLKQKVWITLLITQGLSVKDIYNNWGSPLGVFAALALRALSKSSFFFFSLLLQKRINRDISKGVSLQAAAELEPRQISKAVPQPGQHNAAEFSCHSCSSLSWLISFVGSPTLKMAAFYYHLIWSQDSRAVRLTVTKLLIRGRF